MDRHGHRAHGGWRQLTTSIPRRFTRARPHGLARFTDVLARVDGKGRVAGFGERDWRLETHGAAARPARTSPRAPERSPPLAPGAARGRPPVSHCGADP